MSDPYMAKLDQILDGQQEIIARLDALEAKASALAGNALELVESSGGVLGALGTLSGMLSKNGRRG